MNGPDVSEGAEPPRRATEAFSDGCGLSEPEDHARRKASTRRLVLAIVYCIVFMAAEVGGGIYAGSLAILTDAAHLLSDVASFTISLFAIYVSGWDATPSKSYGFHRAEILGALVSIHIIWLVTGVLVYEAILRLIHDRKPVNGKLMFIIATLGLLVNMGMMFILGGHGHSHDHGSNHSHGHSHDHGSKHTQLPPIQMSIKEDIDHQQGQPRRQSLKLDKDLDPESLENINVRGAYLHALGDLIQSAGVMIAGGIIWSKPKWKVVDPICTFLFSVLVLLTTVKMWIQIFAVLMESTPREIDATRLEEGLMKIRSVQAVHELHIWAITLGKNLLSCHVKVEPDADADEVLRNVIEYCERDFKISHVTIQVERISPHSLTT